MGIRCKRLYLTLHHTYVLIMSYSTAIPTLSNRRRNAGSSVEHNFINKNHSGGSRGHIIANYFVEIEQVSKPISSAYIYIYGIQSRSGVLAVRPPLTLFSTCMGYTLWRFTLATGVVMWYVAI